MNKICSKCQLSKSIDDFYKTYNKKYPNATKSICKMCSNSTRRSYDVVKSMIENAKYRANKKGLEFSISEEDIRMLIILQENKCNLTGWELDWNPSYDGKRVCPPQRASLDRIDSDLGYTKDNIQLVCDIVNRCKNNYDQSMFIDMCESIVNYHHNIEND